MSDDLISFEHLGPMLSSFLIYGLATIGFGAMTAHALVQRSRKLREARSADASVDINPSLAPGPAIVCGTVEYAQGAEKAVRVDIEQDGDESENSGSWSHKWTEKNRRVDVEPFYVRTNGDKRIRVEPSQNVFLIDEMDGLIRVDLTKRVRFAQLTPGERVYASGEIVRANDPEAPAGTGGYRSSNDSLVLRPRPGETMLLSSEPLGARYRVRAAFYSQFVMTIVVVALLFNVFFSGVHIRNWMGETLPIPITRLDHYTTQDDDGDVHHYRVWARLPSGATVADHVHQSTFLTLHVGDVVPFRVVTGKFSDRSTIGPDVTAPFSAFTLLPLLGILLFYYRIEEKNRRPWYERAIVDTGSGRLESTMATEQGRAFVPPT